MIVHIESLRPREFEKLADQGFGWEERFRLISSETRATLGGRRTC